MPGREEEEKSREGALFDPEEQQRAFIYANPKPPANWLADAPSTYKVLKISIWRYSLGHPESWPLLGLQIGRDGQHLEVIPGFDYSAVKAHLNFIKTGEGGPTLNLTGLLPYLQTSSDEIRPSVSFDGSNDHGGSGLFAHHMTDFASTHLHLLQYYGLQITGYKVDGSIGRIGVIPGYDFTQFQEHIKHHRAMTILRLGFYENDAAGKERDLSTIDQGARTAWLEEAKVRHEKLVIKNAIQAKIDHTTQYIEDLGKQAARWTDPFVHPPNAQEHLINLYGEVGASYIEGLMPRGWLYQQADWLRVVYYPDQYADTYGVIINYGDDGKIRGFTQDYTHHFNAPLDSGWRSPPPRTFTGPEELWKALLQSPYNMGKYGIRINIDEYGQITGYTHEGGSDHYNPFYNLFYEASRSQPKESRSSLQVRGANSEEESQMSFFSDVGDFLTDIAMPTTAAMIEHLMAVTDTLAIPGTIQELGVLVDMAEEALGIGRDENGKHPDAMFHGFSQLVSDAVAAANGVFEDVEETVEDQWVADGPISNETLYEDHTQLLVQSDSQFDFMMEKMNGIEENIAAIMQAAFSTTNEMDNIDQDSSITWNIAGDLNIQLTDGATLIIGGENIGVTDGDEAIVEYPFIEVPDFNFDNGLWA